MAIRTRGAARVPAGPAATGAVEEVLRAARNPIFGRGRHSERRAHGRRRSRRIGPTWAGGGVSQRDGKIIRLRARTKGAGRRAGAVFGRPTFSRRTADARGAATPFAREQHAGLLGGRSGDFDAPRLVVDVCAAVGAAGVVRVRGRGE